MQDLYKTIMEASPVAMLVVEGDGSIILCNRAAEQTFGYNTNELTGKNLNTIVPYRNPIESLVDKFATGQPADKIINHNITGFRKDRSQIEARVSLSPMPFEHRQVIFVTIVDHTLLNSTKQGLKEGEARFRAVFKFSPIGMAILGTDGRWLKANNALCEMLGYSEEELMSRTMLDLTHPEDMHNNLNMLHQSVSGELDQYRVEARYFHKNGNTLWISSSISKIVDGAGNPMHLIAQMENITDAKSNQELIQHLEYHDVLTDLPNRRLLIDRLNQNLMQAKRHKRLMAVILLDIDDFKQINETHGHKVGDELLKIVAARLNKCVRSVDTISRQGGDEFVIVLAEISRAQDAQIVANAILKDISQPISIGNIEVQTTSSLGIAIYSPGSPDDVEKLLEKARKALFEMKEEGRNGYRFYLNETLKSW
ncbi:MAG TPA: diguanylate cyclase [Methylophilaceae bacterium]|nr:diguanylate cyclase [Methylophilaceae bacterium]